MVSLATAAVGDVINANIYIIARVGADPRVEQLAIVVIDAHEELLKALTVRNGVANGYQMALARRDTARQQFEALLVAFGLTAAAKYAGRTAEEYLRLLPKAASSFAALSERDLPQAANELSARILDPKTDPDLAKAGAPVVAAAKAYLVAADVLRKSELALADEQKAVQKAKLACIEGQSKLRGLLTAAFPRQSKLLASFFPPTKKKAKVVEASLEPKAPEDQPSQS